ncbi:MAG: hypothetical protein WC045_00060 [Patescibacteria group bacterium]
MVWEVEFDAHLKDHPQRIRLARFDEKTQTLMLWNNSQGIWTTEKLDEDSGWFLAKYFEMF